jgi:hypothetical protein
MILNSSHAVQIGHFRKLSLKPRLDRALVPLAAPADKSAI